MLMISLNWTNQYRAGWGEETKLQLIRKTNVMRCAIWYYLYNLKKVKKHPRRSVTFSFPKSNTPPWVFFTFLNCTNGNISRKASQIKQAVVVEVVQILLILIIDVFRFPDSQKDSWYKKYVDRNLNIIPEFEKKRFPLSQV